MATLRQSLPWESNPGESFVPISHEGKIVGVCKSEYANRIIETLNEDELLRRALHLACYDLVARSGGSTESIDSLIQHYIAKAERPKRGTALIARLLKDRQQDLDVTDDEFAKFCSTYRLSRDELNGIYAGVDIDSNQLTALSRILGMTVDEVIHAWKGSDK
jgi:hypothetical protein